MSHLTDIEIAQAYQLQPMEEIASKLGLSEEDYALYGKNKAKVDHRVDRSRLADKQGKLVLVTAISPTAAGEGKTTTSVGLADAMNQLGYQTTLALREPSLGPVFGMKGGAAGGGYAQVVPMEEINLHFTGDLHAIGAANNLLAAMLDNHIHHGNQLAIDTRTISWKRVVDMNDRQLRQIVDGLGGRTNGVPREDGFDITVASEVMAILCLASDLEDLKDRLGRIVVAFNDEGQPVTAEDLKAHHAMAALLKEAINPNLVQTLEGTPAFIHGGPFANIAHGCNSVIATELARDLSDYVVTEAGFGSDLGAEKFIDIKARQTGKMPDAVVLVATIRALKMHGGHAKDDLGQENLQALKAGLVNLERHLANIRQVFQLPVVVAINKFPTDTAKEQAWLAGQADRLGVQIVESDVWAQGGKGGLALAQAVVDLCQEESQGQFSYNLDLSIQDKLQNLVEKVYGGKRAVLTVAARKQAQQLTDLGYGHLPICVAKTQYSFSDSAKRLGAPEDFDVTIRQLKLSAGAGFIVALTGSIMTMPGLPKHPAAEGIDIDRQGQITGLF
ncbi:formate--tetrahydrofolate ligase [Hutsoniella sourekii]